MSRTTMNWTTLSSSSAIHFRSIEAVMSSASFRLRSEGLQVSRDHFSFASIGLTTASGIATMATMRKRYEQYCPVAHALALVGERWALLVVRELMHGPKRYTDLAEHLPGIGTNILAARLRDLERHGVVARRTLPPPAASKVYELTDYGRELRPAMRELAVWGARSLGPPTDETELFDGWLANAMDTVI